MTIYRNRERCEVEARRLSRKHGERVSVYRGLAGWVCRLAGLERPVYSLPGGRERWSWQGYIVDLKRKE